jgi:excisionase family DNA binding protein
MGIGEPGPGHERPTMTAPELAARVGVHESTVYRYLRAGKLPGVQAGGSWLIDWERVERFMAGQEDASGRPLVTPVSVRSTATLTVLPEPASDDALDALRWLHGLRAALGLLAAGVDHHGGQERRRVTG